MKRAGRLLLIFALGSTSLLAENWRGLAILGGIFISMMAMCQLPFLLLGGWLAATRKASRGLWIIAIVGSLLTVIPLLALQIKAWKLVDWALVWFAIGFVVYSITKAAHPIWIGAGIMVASFVSACVAVNYI